MAVIETAERLLPPGLKARLAPLTRKLEAILTNDDETARAQRRALTAFVIRIFSAAIAFVSQIVLARLMGEFEYGIFAFVWVLVVLAGNLSCLGFHTSVIRFLHQHRARGELATVRGLNLAVRLVALVSASAVAGLGFLFLYVFGDTVEAYYLVPIALAFFTMPMIALGDVLDGTARSNGWTVTALSPTYLIRPALILAFMLLAIWLGAPQTAVTAMQAALAATYVTTLSQLLRLTLRLRREYGPGPKRFELGAWFRYSLPLFLVDGIGFLLTNADVVVVGIYLPPDQVGIYYAAAKTIVLVQFVYFSIKAAAGPRFSAIMAEGDMPALAAFAGQMARWSFWPSLAVGLAALAAGELLLSLFGSAFTAGYWLMAILFAGILAKSLVGPGEVLLSMAGRQNLCVLLYAATLAASIGLYVVLIPRLGLTGAALATAAGMMIEAVLLHIAVRRTLGIVLFAFADPAPSASPKVS
ncbi:Membrane protein involved in the export of O-antigen and teichoic acid [Xaviernesmea oryzae]|uniref:Membrane protein involved in the export of O-antigen and teichoic acid n=1 Tax=Xaviernesmea oryzae TaxID=464029 RepID=A0A1X7CFH1_9HYPH|nr:lipopolysaccharide biosynthesis protein [Xaviernesmea oryzae]SME95710.1 Membrane protein involved in the export of O-antigen and teichoic acid [Xaviernesmea oryzae]